MGRVLDHPVRLARLQLGLSQVGLAGRAGVSRSAVTAIEDGRTRRPDERILGVLALGLGVSVGEFGGRVAEFVSEPVVVLPKAAVVNLCGIPPYVLCQYYKSFRQWREEVAVTPTGFASLLRLNPAVVSRYESGRVKAFPEVLGRRLVEVFGVFGLSPEYVVELEKLPADV